MSSNVLDHPPRGAANVVFIGQGPNQTSWTRALYTARRLNPSRTDEERVKWAVDFCARVAITGAIGTKIGAMIDLAVGDFFRSPYGRRNLNARFNGKAGKGDLFDVAEAKIAADALARDARFSHFVLLGAEVGRAFGVRCDWLEMRFDKTTGKNFLLFPHPSGLNQWWNDDFNRFRARKRLRDFLGLK